MFVSAQFDTVVPERNQDLLWEALGRPARMRVPFGHYTSALAISSVLAAAAEHFTALMPQKPEDNQKREDEGKKLTNAYGRVRRM